METIMKEVAESSETDPELLLTLAIRKANHAIYERGQSRDDLCGMGTTVAALLINKEKATAAHVGDNAEVLLGDDGSIFITDKSSTNGTTVRGNESGRKRKSA
ncbi:hypothetical protein FACS189435_2770 [Bacteroidia bacterium]|nr:hypothetical protein FACS189435_2770 [Bacteroidia bacterium]